MESLYPTAEKQHSPMRSLIAAAVMTLAPSTSDAASLDCIHKVSNIPIGVEASYVLVTSGHPSDLNPTCTRENAVWQSGNYGYVTMRKHDINLSAMQDLRVLTQQPIKEPYAVLVVEMKKVAQKSRAEIMEWIGYQTWSKLCFGQSSSGQKCIPIKYHIQE